MVEKTHLRYGHEGFSFRVYGSEFRIQLRNIKYHCILHI